MCRLSWNLGASASCNWITICNRSFIINFTWYGVLVCPLHCNGHSCISNCKKIRTIPKYQLPVMNLKVSRICPAASNETACLFNANLLSIRALRHFGKRKMKWETLSSCRHPLLILVAGHQYHSLGSYYSIIHCTTKTEWSSVTKYSYQNVIRWTGKEKHT
jgi:hypothetical protein